MFRSLNAMAAAAVVIASTLIFSGHAYAHERRMVGPYQFVVGWLNEPAYVGQLNSLDLRVTDTRKDPATAAVTGLEKSLTVEMSAGGLAPYKPAITARFGTAGAYNAFIQPTTTGTWTFHIAGTIDQTKVDEKFTSGPGTFGDIESLADIQYPAKVAVADDLNKKLDAIQSGVDQTRIIAIVAAVVGLAALGMSFMSRRRA